MTKDGPASPDVGIGQRVRAFRLQKGLSQQNFADQLGVTFRQVQNYENGADHIGVERLHVIAAILGVQVYDFFTLAGQRRVPPRSGTARAAVRRTKPMQHRLLH